MLKLWDAKQLWEEKEGTFVRKIFDDKKYFDLVKDVCNELGKDAFFNDWISQWLQNGYVNNQMSVHGLVENARN